MKNNKTVFIFLLFMASANLVNAQTIDLNVAKNNNQLFLGGNTYYVNKNVSNAGSGSFY